jgi:tetratricopeptide (TPR) repeat protein
LTVLAAPRARRWSVAVALALATFALYAPVATHGFLHYDDDLYVTDNPVVRRGLSWDGVAWAFTSLEVSSWQPLTWLSHMLAVQLFGLDAGAHLLVNAGLHAANAALLFLALARLTAAPARSAVVAALFAVHPLHVESVAWLSERKDVLGTLFGFLTLGAYAGYVERPRWSRRAAVAALLALSLMAKPMWVTAPLLLLLLDAWPLRRFQAEPRWRLLAEKAPLLALSAASAAVAVVAQHRSGAVVGLEYGPGARLANAAVSYARYLGKTFRPAGLAAFYPYPAGGHAAGAVAGSAVLLAAITAVALLRRRAWPWLGVGWGWFLLTLVPVIGIVQTGMQAMADRYTYLPLVGVFIAVVWTAAEAARGAAARRGLAAAAALVVVALGATTHRQIGVWADQVTLFRHAIAVTGENARAELFLAQGLSAAGEREEAVVHAREAARLEPWNARAQKNLGYMLYRVGRLDDAILALERAVALDPGYAEAHGNLAVAYRLKGWSERAGREARIEADLRRASPHVDPR